MFGTSRWTLRVLRIAAVGLGLSAGIAGSAGAAVVGDPVRTWVPNGSVDAMAVDGSTAYIGGNFSQIAPYTGASVRLDSSTAEAMAPWPEVHGDPLPGDGSGRKRAAVQAAVEDGSGGWYLGGRFSSIGGIPRQNLAHVLADGTVDPAWAPTTDGDVRVLLVSRLSSRSPGTSRIYAGGVFSKANGAARSNLAAFTLGTGALSGPVYGVSSATEGVLNGVHTLAIRAAGVAVAPILYVGGRFDTASGTSGSQARNAAAAFDTVTGGVTAFDPRLLPAGSAVRAMAIGDTRVYVGGTFTRVNTVSDVDRGGLAAFDVTSGAKSAWNPNRPCCVVRVEALAVSGTVVYAGATGDTGSTGHKALEAYDSSTGALLPWNPPVKRNGANVRALTVTGGTIVAGGSFESADGEAARRNLAAYDLTTGAATTWAPNGTGPVHAIGAQDGSVVAGGDFETYGGVPRRNLAAIDLNTGRPTAFNPPMNGPSANLAGVSALALNSAGLWAGGDFTTEAPDQRTYLGLFDRTTGAVKSFSQTVDSPVTALAAIGDTVFIGGNFERVGTEQRRFLAGVRHVEGGPGEVLLFNADVRGGDVTALASAGTTLYLGGGFQRVNGTVGHGGLAAVETNRGDALPWDPSPNAKVRTLMLSGGTMYAGGDFTQMGGVDRSRLAAVDAASGAVLPFDAKADGVVHALALHGNALFAGGDFRTIGAVPGPRNGLASLDATTGALLGGDPALRPNPNSGFRASAPDADPAIRSLVATPATGLLAGGRFLSDTAGIRGIHWLRSPLAPLPPTQVPANAGDGSAKGNFTPPGGLSTRLADTAAPVIGGFVLKPTSVKRKKPTTVASFTLSEPASVKVLVTRNLPGTKRGKSGATCKATAKRGKGKKGCTATKTVLTLSSSRTAGAQKVTVKLKKNPAIGRYAVSVVATDPAGNTATAKPVTLNVKR